MGSADVFLRSSLTTANKQYRPLTTSASSSHPRLSRHVELGIGVKPAFGASRRWHDTRMDSRRTSRLTRTRRSRVPRPAVFFPTYRGPCLRVGVHDAVSYFTVTANMEKRKSVHRSTSRSGILLTFQFQRKSVEGLSILLFVFAFCGNLSYVLSILLNPSGSADPSEAGHYLLEALP